MGITANSSIQSLLNGIPGAAFTCTHKKMALNSVCHCHIRVCLSNSQFWKVKKIVSCNLPNCNAGKVRSNVGEEVSHSARWQQEPSLKHTEAISLLICLKMHLCPSIFALCPHKASIFDTQKLSFFEICLQFWKHCLHVLVWAGKTERLEKQQSERKRMPRQKTDRDNRGRNQDQESEGQKVKARGEKKRLRKKEREVLGSAWAEWRTRLQPICRNHNQSQLNGCDKLQPGAHSLNQAGRLQGLREMRRGEEEAEERRGGGILSIVCSPIGPVREGAGTGGVKGGIKRVPVTGALS